MQRFFTVREAETLLPRLEATFAQIRLLREEIDTRMDQIQILDALWGKVVQEPANPDREEFLAHRAGVKRAIGEIERRVEREILGLGVRFPQGGLERGLVDFPTRYRGRTVYLCWQAGESGIVAWHEVEDGFAGRRPLTAEEAIHMGREGEDG
ncbi:MAG: DUF2203 domain-containing protein [Gemmatimonadota bacterium]